MFFLFKGRASRTRQDWIQDVKKATLFASRLSRGVDILTYLYHRDWLSAIYNLIVQYSIFFFTLYVVLKTPKWVIVKMLRTFMKLCKCIRKIQSMRSLPRVAHLTHGTARFRFQQSGSKGASYLLCSAASPGASDTRFLPAVWWENSLLCCRYLSLW